MILRANTKVYVLLSGHSGQSSLVPE